MIFIASTQDMHDTMNILVKIYTAGPRRFAVTGELGRRGDVNHSVELTEMVGNPETFILRTSEMQECGFKEETIALHE